MIKKNKNFSTYKQERGYSQVALVVKNLLAYAGDVRDMGSIPGSGRCPEEGNGNPFQHSAAESHGQRSLVAYTSRNTD